MTDQTIAHLQAENRALASQLRECAETLGADQIDEQRAMRAYADGNCVARRIASNIAH